MTARIGGFARVTLGAKSAWLALCLLGSGALSPVFALNVDSQHPRIVFHAADLATVRARINGPHAALFDDYYAWAANRLEDGRRNSYDADDYAAIYLLTGENRFGDAAISIAMDMISRGQDTSGEGDGPARSSAISLVYDWCYARLSTSQRSTIYAALYPNVNVHPDYHQAWFIRDYNWSYMMAIANDGTASQNAAVIANLEESIAQFEDFFIPCLDHSSPESAIDGYAGLRIMTLLCFVDALDRSTDYQGSVLSSNYYRNTGRFWMARMRPDFRWAKMPGKYNTSESEPGAYFSYAGAFLGDRDAQYMANLLVNDEGLGGRDATMALAWHDPNAPANPQASLAKDYYDPVAGFVLDRSGWTMGNNSSDVTLGFFNGTDQVGHRTQNHFYVTRGDDNLIIDSGHRFPDLANHTTRTTHDRSPITRCSSTIPARTSAASPTCGATRSSSQRRGQTDSDDAEGEARWRSATDSTALAERSPSTSRPPTT
ncbi:MAG: hypothetical protein R3E12_18230 [Candidatus Eisenbacteria bacterium]